MGIEISNPGGGGITVETDPLALLKTGGIMSGNIRFDEVGIQSIGKGTFDAGRGAYNGISLICANDVELNWQAGYLKAMYNGSVVPINFEDSGITLITNRDGVEEEIPSYTRTITIGNSSISYNGNNEIGDYSWGINDTSVSGINNSDSGYGIGLSGAGGNLANGSTFGLNTFGVGGNNDEYPSSWGFDCNGLGGYNGDGNPSDTSFGLSALKVVGHIDTYVDPYTEETVPAKDWEFGVDGAKFIDGTIQTSAGVTIDSYEGGINLEAQQTYGGFRVYQTRNDGDGDYLAIGQLNTFGFNFVSEGNPNGDWNYGQFQDGIHFNDGTIQATAGLPLTGGTLTGDLIVKNNGDDEFFKIIPGNGTVTVGYDQGAAYTQQSNDWIVINGQVGSESTGTIIIGRNYDNGNDTYGIKFYDGSYQTTAGGYLGTSTTSNTVDSGNGKIFYTQKYLLYTPYQKIVIVATGTSNHMYGQVVSYNKTTGQLVFDADIHSGSGTHTNWTINVGG